jgi:anti-sigma B factor antagonist
MSDLLRLELSGDRLCLFGELELTTAPILVDALAAQDTAAVVLDLAGVTFLDSTGLRTLIEARRSRRVLRITNPTDAITRLADLTGTADLLFDEDG